MTESLSAHNGMFEVHCIVSGKVQGVGFRDFVAKKARALWCNGFVENKGPGAMVVVAQGEEGKLQRLIEHLHKGPFLARVRDVEIEWREPQTTFSDFSIHY